MIEKHYGINKIFKTVTYFKKSFLNLKSLNVVNPLINFKSRPAENVGLIMIY